MSGFSATSTKSVQNARRDLTQFLKTLQTVPEQILAEEAQTIKAEAIAEAPFKSGKLERSIYVRVSRNKRKPGLVAGASARARNYNYAGIQHENTAFRHPIKGKAHYISDPFHRSIKRIERKLASRVRLGR